MAQKPKEKDGGMNKNESVYIYFSFTWWKLHWYWVKKRKELNYEQQRSID